MLSVISQPPRLVVTAGAGPTNGHACPPPPAALRAPLAIGHPARYSRQLLPLFAELLDDRPRVLDPFAGTGERLATVVPAERLWLNELEPEWAEAARATQATVTQGDARCLPYPDSFFAAVCTSPTFGNRMADNFEDHRPEHGYVRNTYRHVLGRPLSPGNSGALQWGEAYRALHRAAWTEAVRVLAPGGLFVLNISDHIRAGRRIPVSAWHRVTLEELGLIHRETHEVATPRQRMGANHAARVECEYVMVFGRVETP